MKSPDFTERTIYLGAQVVVFVLAALMRCLQDNTHQTALGIV